MLQGCHLLCKIPKIDVQYKQNILSKFRSVGKRFLLFSELWQVGFLYVLVPCQHLKTVSTDGGVGRQHEPLETKHKLAVLILVTQCH